MIWYSSNSFLKSTGRLVVTTDYANIISNSLKFFQDKFHRHTVYSTTQGLVIKQLPLLIEETLSRFAPVSCARHDTAPFFRQCRATTSRDPAVHDIRTRSDACVATGARLDNLTRVHLP